MGYVLQSLAKDKGDERSQTEWLGEQNREEEENLLSELITF